MRDIEKMVSLFCAQNFLALNLSYDMPEGYETAFGTYDVTGNTLYLNRDLLQSAPQWKVLYYVYHELRHAMQYLKPERFDETIQESRFYVVLYNGICFKLEDHEWKKCVLEGKEDDFTAAYLSLPYEMDANTFAYEQIKALWGDLPELLCLYHGWMPEKKWSYEKCRILFQHIDAKLMGNRSDRELRRE